MGVVLQYKAKYRDVGFTIAFLVQLLAVIALLIVNCLRYWAWDDFSSEAIFIDADNTITIGFILPISGAIGFSFGIFWLTLMFYFTKAMIYFSFFGTLLLFLGLGIYFILMVSFFSGVIFLIFAVIFGIFFVMWRKSIPFAVALIQTATKLIRKYPATLFYSFIALILQIVWVLAWGLTASLSLRYSGAVSYLFYIVLLFSFFWVSQVIKGVVHMTTSGTVGTWYFSADSVVNPTAKSFMRAVTTSFGSVCCGSLLISIIKTLRAIAWSLRSTSRFLAVIMDWILGCIESIMRYFNHYVLVYCALYGKGYWKAAKDTIHLFEHGGLYALVTDNLTGTILLMGSVFGGIVTACLTGIIAYFWIDDWVFVAIMGFAIGWILCSMILQLIDSGVSTIFVCYAEDPLALQQNDPELYERFVVALNEASG